MAIKFELFGLRETFNNVFEGDNVNKHPSESICNFLICNDYYDCNK